MARNTTKGEYSIDDHLHIIVSKCLTSRIRMVSHQAIDVFCCIICNEYLGYRRALHMARRLIKARPVVKKEKPPSSPLRSHVNAAQKDADVCHITVSTLSGFLSCVLRNDASIRLSSRRCPLLEQRYRPLLPQQLPEQLHCHPPEARPLMKSRVSVMMLVVHRELWVPSTYEVVSEQLHDEGRVLVRFLT